MKNLLWMVGGGSEATVGGSSCLHCTASTNSFVLHLVNWSLTVEPELFLSIWPGALSAMLRYLIVSLLVRHKILLRKHGFGNNKVSVWKNQKAETKLPVVGFCWNFLGALDTATVIIMTVPMTQNSNPNGATLLWLLDSPAGAEHNNFLHSMKAMRKKSTGHPSWCSHL